MSVPSTIPPPFVDRAAWGAVQAFMRSACGVVLDADQAYLIDARLAPVARAHGFARIADYVAAACAAAPGTPLAIALIDAMTTHETLFFRDPPFWRALEAQVLPRLDLRAKAGAPVRIWSAACSTGQEPYSLAMLLAERFPALAAKVEILATDVSAPAIARARAGVYGALEIGRGVSAARLAQHFEPVSGGYRVRDGLRPRITWSVHNVLGPRPDPIGCALVLCRNVLIYFGDDDRALATRRLFQATAPDGVVGVGSTESLRATALAPGLYVRPT